MMVFEGAIARVPLRTNGRNVWMYVCHELALLVPRGPQVFMVVFLQFL